MATNAAGIYPMLYAFFGEDGRLDEMAIRRQAQTAKRHGAHGLAALGLGTEVGKLSSYERVDLLGWAADELGSELPLLAPYNLRWLEEPLIADDIAGYAELHALNIVPISGGITPAQKIAALAEAFNIAVIPHAGQMHNYHVVMANIACPMAEYFTKVPVEVGNELFWYIFDGEPVAENGYVSLQEDRPGLGLKIKPDLISQFRIT